MNFRWLFPCIAMCSAQCSRISIREQPEHSRQDESEVFIEITGIAQDAGYPQMDCRKSCCANLLNSRQTGARVVSLLLVDRRDTSTWLFEATPDLKSQWQDALELSSGRSPKGIFITHAHMGHYSGLMQLGRESLNSRSLPVFTLPRMEHFLSSNGPWDQLVQLNNIQITPLQVGESTLLKDDLSVTPIAVPHRDEYSETAGYLIKGPLKSVLFIPDIDKWEKWSEPIEKWLKQVDYALLDGTFYDVDELPGRDMSEIPHPFVVESMKRFDALPDSIRRRIVFIHFNHTNPILRDSSLRSLIRSKGFGLASEGLRLHLSN